MKKLLIIVFVGIWLTIGIGVFIVLVFPQLVIAPYINIKFSEDKVPSAHTIPIQKTISKPKADPATYPEFSYYNLKFKAPWKNTSSEKVVKRATLLKFSDSKSIAIIDPKLTIKPRETLLGDDPNNAKKVRDFFGEAVMSSNYDFFKNILFITPSEVTIFTPKKEALAKSVLVILKPLLVVAPGGESAIYSFDTGEVRGFQFGRPQVKNPIQITLFDDEDTMYDVIIRGTQEEIDFFLYTLKVKRF